MNTSRSLSSSANALEEPSLAVESLAKLESSVTFSRAPASHREARAKRALARTSRQRLECKRGNGPSGAVRPVPPGGIIPGGKHLVDQCLDQPTGDVVDRQADLLVRRQDEANLGGRVEGIGHVVQQPGRHLNIRRCGGGPDVIDLTQHPVIRIKCHRQNGFVHQEIVPLDLCIVLHNVGFNSGIGFAISVNILKRVAPSLIETGRVEYPFLGVSSLPELSVFDQEDLNLPQTTGALITSITPDGPADLSGLQVGDLITHIDGREVLVFGDLLSYLITQKGPGDEVLLTVIRGDETLDLSVVLGSR